MDLIPKAISGPAGRVASAAQNALEVARFGGLETGEEPSPFEIVREHRVYRLRRYFAPDHDDTASRNGKRTTRPPVLLVPPMMLAAEVYDVSPNATAVGVLAQEGVDPYVVDFGAPEREEGGLERNLADHVLAVSDAVDTVRRLTGRDVHLAGYSQGGMFCYQTAAYRKGEGLSSLITFGSPVDMTGALPFGIPEQVAARGAGAIAGFIGQQFLPAWASRIGFRLLDPVKAVRQQVEFVMQLHDREALLPRERQRRFLQGEGWVAWPGPAMADFIRQFVEHNRMLSGGIVIEDRLVTLADLALPILTFVGSVDEIAPAPAVRAIRRAAPSADLYEVTQRVGHFGLVVGSAAKANTWPTVADWVKWRDDEGEAPESAHPVTEDIVDEDETGNAGTRVGYGLELVGDVGGNVARAWRVAASRTAKSVREITREAASQLPRLARLEQIQPSTRISLGLLLDEQARKSPESVLFLFEGRAYSQAQAKFRIDAVVRGLISIGVRRGDHVGVLMGTRPTALATMAALSRLGAVTVFIRPDGDLEREMELGQCTRVIADPENAARVEDMSQVHAFVLGGGGEPRDLGVEMTDMEQIDHEAVELPAWYKPNPGRASDLAFVLFTGEGERTRVNRITNRRWALSAFGTASSAALSPADTVYSVTPLHHPSGLLMSIGGAVAGGARIAMATHFDPATFWDEVRRYGVTIASYTWTLLHDLVEAEPHPNERHHPVRLFIGSGMPRGLWRRACDRFAPAQILEFYSSTEGGAILVNLTGHKPGSMGRRLPGSPEVELVAFDLDSRAIINGPDGYARRCEVDEPGLLVFRLEPGEPTTSAPLRGLFSPDDAWLSTRDLFRRDADGDYWLIDNIPQMLLTADGRVPTVPIRDALGDIPAVDTAAVYGVPARGDEDLRVVVAAITLRSGRSVEPGDVTDALSVLKPEHRPAVVHVVDSIPVTTWYRPIVAPLREQGMPAPGDGVWYFDKTRGKYRPLTQTARKKLVPA